MKGKNFKILNNWLIIFSVTSTFIFGSCDLDEIDGIKDVKVKTEARVVLPLAYGSFEIQNIIDYMGTDNSILQFNNDGSFGFEPVITEIQFPDTFAFQGSLLNVLSYLELRIETENSLPLGISLEMIFTDSGFSTQFGPSVFCELLNPGIIDQTGKVTEASRHVENIILTKESIEEYQKASNIIADIRFFLPETKSNLIYLNHEDSLLINVGVVVQAKTNE